MKLPWCIAGDFNVVRFQSKRSNGSRSSSHMRRFDDFISAHQLMDPPLEGADFTWSNMQDSPSFIRLDRVLMFEDWEEQFQLARQSALPNTISDHIPIMPRMEERWGGPQPFKFELMWLQVDGFADKVKQWWGEAKFEGLAGFFFFCKKLRAIKNNIKRWNKEVLGSIVKKKEACLERIGGLDRQEHQRGLSEEEKIKREEEKKEYMRWLLMEETSWKQKSRISWLKEGDRNTRFFHKIATLNEKNNCIDSLQVGGVWVIEPRAIVNTVVDHFNDLCKEPFGVRPVLNGLQFRCVSDQQKEELERPFLEEEVLEALASLKEDNAPGPDGFPMKFYKVFWEVIKDDVMAVLSDFNQRASWCRSLNLNFISLIPKKNGAKVLNDFRPICLLSSVYKLLAKILARRLGRVLSDLIS